MLLPETTPTPRSDHGSASRSHTREKDSQAQKTRHSRELCVTNFFERGPEGDTDRYIESGLPESISSVCAFTGLTSMILKKFGALQSIYQGFRQGSLQIEPTDPIAGISVQCYVVSVHTDTILQALFLIFI